MLDGPDEDGESVLSEKSPYEPDEFDPSSLGPDVPEAPDPPDGAANTEVTALFWKLVVVFNVALLALSVGPMLAYFEGQVDFGLQLFAAGVILFSYGIFRYVQFARDRGDSDDVPTDGENVTGDDIADVSTDKENVTGDDIADVPTDGENVPTDDIADTTTDGGDNVTGDDIADTTTDGGDNVTGDDTADHNG